MRIEYDLEQSQEDLNAQFVRSSCSFWGGILRLQSGLKQIFSNTRDVKVAF